MNERTYHPTMCLLRRFRDVFYFAAATGIYFGIVASMGRLASAILTCGLFSVCGVALWVLALAVIE